MEFRSLEDGWFEECGKTDPGSSGGSSLPTYRVNCRHCGGIFEVVSPRLHERPVEIWTTDWGLTSDKTSLTIVACPYCGHRNAVKFRYP